MKIFTRRRIILCILFTAGLIIVVNMLLLNKDSIAFRFPGQRLLRQLNTLSILNGNQSSAVSHKDKAITVQVLSRRILKPTSLLTTSSTTKHPNKRVTYFGGHLAENKVWRAPLQVRGKPTSLLKRSPTLVVPNIVHYIWFGKNPLRFHHMLSMISAYKYIKPDKMFLHCDQEPLGKWWPLVKKNITTLVVVRMTAPRMIFGNPVSIPEHQSDVVRIESLMKYGGIYLDFDVLVLKSFDELRHYEYTMGIEYHGRPGRLNSGVIVATKNATFLRLWYESFHYFNTKTKNWDHQCCIVPYYMQYQFPNLIHVEEKSLNYPSGLITKLIYKQVYDWSHNYAMHLWFRSYKIEHSPEDIKRMNTTFGEMARYIFYGSKKMM